MSQPLPVARLADRSGLIEQPQPQPQQPRGMAASLSATVTAASVGKASRRHHRRISHTVTTKAQRTWTTPAGTGRYLDGVCGGGGEGGGAAAVPLDRGSERDSSVNGSMSATGSMCSETEQSDHE